MQKRRILGKMARIAVWTLSLAQSFVLFKGASASVPNVGTIFGMISGYPTGAIHARVIALLLQSADGRPWFAKQCDVEVDADGIYRCPMLPTGSYLIYAEPEGQREHTAASADGGDLALTFYPGTTDIEEAELARVMAGEVSTQNFSIDEVPLFRISGHLEEKPVSAALSLSRFDGAHGYDVDTSERVYYNSASGEFVVDNVSSGSYVLRGRWFISSPDQHSQIPQYGSVSISVMDRDVSMAMLQAETVTTVNGSVDLEGSTPGRSMRIEMQDVGDSRHQVVAVVTPDGHFQCTDVTSGTYRINKIDPPDGYVRSVWVNGRDLGGRDVVVGDGQSSISLRIMLGLDGAAIEGLITDWHSFQSSAVVLVKDLNGDIYTTDVDGAGRFRIINLPPGDYDLYAWNDLKDILYATRHGLDSYQDGKISVSLGERETVTGISLQVLPKNRGVF
jgi:hypothetical protein